MTFQSAVPYALYPEMRRLLIVYLAGALIHPFGSNLLLLLGLVGSAVGATLFFGDSVGVAFELVSDANSSANTE